MKNFSLYFPIIIILLLLGRFSVKITDEYQIGNKIDLPEEYKLIDKSTAIIGYFDKDSILHIEFDNSIKFKWEGSESDIPQDGIRQLQLSTNENTVYLNPVDE